MHIAMLAKIILFLEAAQILLLFLNQSFSLFNFIFLIDSFRIEYNNKLGFSLHIKKKKELKFKKKK